MDPVPDDRWVSTKGVRDNFSRRNGFQYGGGVGYRSLTMFPDGRNRTKSCWEFPVGSKYKREVMTPPETTLTDLEEWDRIIGRKEYEFFHNKDSRLRYLASVRLERVAEKGVLSYILLQLDYDCDTLPCLYRLHVKKGRKERRWGDFSSVWNGRSKEEDLVGRSSSYGVTSLRYFPLSTIPLPNITTTLLYVLFDTVYYFHKP